MNLPKISNIIGHGGNEVKNQFIIRTKGTTIFQSYDSIICMINHNTGITTLDKNYWDYSTTTGKYRNIFLGESKQDTEKKIKSKEYKLKNLN
ncbi:MAG: hypothetical protein GY760_22415 [Deltaproteobacteria bacterium]|jgi:hypothetical protein|nr:hypothetical protein [Deltaproteobacteria bacterium]